MPSPGVLYQTTLNLLFFYEDYVKCFCKFKMFVLQLTDLQKLMEEQKPPIDLDLYVKKLVNCRRKVVVVNSVLNNAHVSTSNY